jgi:hypothetical protein
VLTPNTPDRAYGSHQAEQWVRTNGERLVNESETDCSPKVVRNVRSKGDRRVIVFKTALFCSDVARRAVLLCQRALLADVIKHYII